MANPEAGKPPGPDGAETERRAEDEARKVFPGDPPPPPFLEVTCRSSGSVRRFAAGTTARYALHTVNRKLAPGSPAALHVEAAKDGEEPVCFGPSVPLADYGRGWRLQTVTEQDAPGAPDFTKKRGGDGDGEEAKADRQRKKGATVYLAKIGLAFVFLFLLGGLFTFLLETIPDMIHLASAHESM